MLLGKIFDKMPAFLSDFTSSIRQRPFVDCFQKESGHLCTNILAKLICHQLGWIHSNFNEKKGLVATG